MRRVSVVIMLTVMFWLTGLCMVWAERGPTYHAPRLEGVVMVDGKLDEAIWSATPKAGPFLDNRDGKPAPVQTTAQVVYDEDNIYVAVRCEEPLIEKLRAEFAPPENREILRDDAVELFFDPMATGKHFYQFIINPRGVGVTGDGTNYETRLPFEAKGQVLGTEWVLEVCIPFAQFAVRPRFGDLWGMDIFRTRVDKGDGGCAFSMASDRGRLQDAW